MLPGRLVLLRSASRAIPCGSRASTRTIARRNLSSQRKEGGQLVYDLKRSPGKPVNISWTNDALHVRHYPALSPTTLRDSCACAKCRDPASGNKSFASVEIPLEIGIRHVRATDQGLGITFTNDIPRYAQDGDHEMMLPWAHVEPHALDTLLPRKHSILRRTGVQYWDAATLDKHVRKIDYSAYMQDDSRAFWDAVIDICRLGIVYLTGVPRDEDSVVRITTRLANIRETFYGRTFDVRAKPDAENVAYTSSCLGLHQDLMYLEPPPMIQVLHCMENSCDGGESLFSDGERIGRLLWPFVSGASSKMAPLADHLVPYQYDKNGHRYFSSRPVIEGDGYGGFMGVHWSPPFQGRYPGGAKDLKPWIAAARVFESHINASNAVHCRKMEPGECVIFDNLRTMHGRTSFDVSKGGSRWLRGAYIAAEDFLSRASHIPEGQAEAYRGRTEWSPEDAQRELKDSPWHKHVFDAVRRLD